ncbi:MAG TPA: hypothetical protein VFQ53_01585 [Kofleriaceae bacterium]|nr:hypothetical protein [Kofleriaceae bacterium]
MRRAALVVLLAACEPGYGYQARLRDPADRPIEGATLAIACSAERGFASSAMVKHTDVVGRASSISIGAWQPDCDLFIAKPGYRTQRLRAIDLCLGERHCSKVFDLDLVMEPE